jgi:hypothetical protein
MQKGLPMLNLPISAIVGAAAGLAIISWLEYGPNDTPTYLILVVCISIAVGIGKLVKGRAS